MTLLPCTSKVKECAFFSALPAIPFMCTTLWEVPILPCTFSRVHPAYYSSVLLPCTSTSAFPTLHLLHCAFCSTLPVLRFLPCTAFPSIRFFLEFSAVRFLSRTSCYVLITLHLLHILIYTSSSELPTLHLKQCAYLRPCTLRSALPSLRLQQCAFYHALATVRFLQCTSTSTFFSCTSSSPLPSLPEVRFLLCTFSSAHITHHLRQCTYFPALPAVHLLPCTCTSFPAYLQ